MDLRNGVNFRDLIQRFSYMSGVSFSGRIMNYKNGEFLKLFRSDVLQLVSRFVPKTLFMLIKRVSHFGVVEYAEAITTFFAVAQKWKFGQDSDTELEVLRGNSGFFWDQLHLAAEKKIATSVRPYVHPSGFLNVFEERFYWAAILYYISWKEESPKRSSILKEALDKLEGLSIPAPKTTSTSETKAAADRTSLPDFFKTYVDPKNKKGKYSSLRESQFIENFYLGPEEDVCVLLVIRTDFLF